MLRTLVPSRPLAPALASGLSTTAAHSTLVIADTNSTRIRDDGTLAAGVEEVTLALRSSVEGQLIETSHNGYARRFGMLVRRRPRQTSGPIEVERALLTDSDPRRSRSSPASGS